ncbi:MAG TPA: hypothetical protein VGM84_24660 [Steroidobacteraceae bacterium]|jgi:uncharacterized protein YfcZ (UPF0381/DUF406 family)
MQFAGTIYEAAARIEEATAVYRFKARQIASEYDDVTGRWGDSRARQFDQLHLQSQREAMDEGERLCRQLSELCDAAKRSAGEAEQQLSACFALQSEFEASTTDVNEFLDNSHKLSTRVNTDTASLPAEIRAVDGAVAQTAQDIGWKPKPTYEGPAKKFL